MANVKAFLGDSVIYGIGTAIKKLIGILLLPFYARALSPEEYGIIDILATSVFFLSVFCSIGLNGASARFFYKADNNYSKGEVLFTSIIIRTLLSIVVIGLLLPFSGDISYHLFKSYNYKWAVFISLLLIPVSILSEDQSSIYRYYRKAIQFNIMSIIQSLLNIGVGIYLVLIIHKGVVGVNFASFLSAFIVIVISFFAFTKKKYTYNFNISIAKKMLKYGFPLIGVGLLGWVLSVSDRYFLLYYKNLKEIGLFAIGNTFSKPLMLINTAVLMSQGVLIMSTYEKEIDENKPRTKALANRILQIYLLLSVPIILCLSIFGTLLVKYVTTTEYLQGAVVIPFLGFSSVFTVMFVLTGYGMDLKLKTNYYFWIMLVAASMNFGLNIYFIPHYGFLGAGITTLISNIFYWAMAYYYSQRFFYVKRELSPILIYLFTMFVFSILVPIIEIQFTYPVHLFYKCLIFVVGIFVPFMTGMVSRNDLSQFKKLIFTKIK